MGQNLNWEQTEWWGRHRLSSPWLHTVNWSHRVMNFTSISDCPAMLFLKRDSTDEIKNVIMCWHDISTSLLCNIMLHCNFECHNGMSFTGV